jgi:hypothetical protein
MKKTFLIFGLLLAFVFVNAQNSIQYVSPTDGNALSTKSIQNPIQFPTPKKGSIILWDNSNVDLTGLAKITSTYWAGNDNWTWAADDFDADEKWIIEKIYSMGMYPDPPEPGVGEPLTTDKMIVAIYETSPDSCSPGTEIFRSGPITVEDALNPEIVLPEPFTLPSAGKYWITIAGYYTTSCGSNADVKWNRWSLRRGTPPIECNLRFYEKIQIFTNPPGFWIDQGATSAYFMIEGQKGIQIDCEPVTNLKAEYKDNCTKTELTWSAPSSGNFKYDIIRDGFLLTTVETESYTDITFEPTLGHSWEIVVDCDGYSPPTRVTLLNCKEPDCQLRPHLLSLAVEEFEDHCETSLKWEAPAELIYENTNITNTGIDSYRCISSASGTILADDFVVPAGEKWLITQLFGGGFYQTTLQHYDKPDYLGLEIFKDNGNQLPGERIYEDSYQTPILGSMQQTFTLLLDPPIEVEPGRYWVSFYGTYLGDEDEQKTRWLAYQTTVPKGAQWARYDYSIGTWETYNNGDYVSMSFNLLGVKTADPIKYNIYRDGIIIDSDVTERSYLDKEYDSTKPHTWLVKAVCLNGIGVSAPVYASMTNCKPDTGEGITENENDTFTIFPNPSSNEITISAQSNFNTIQVINFLGQTVISQSNIHSAHQTLDVSNLNAGVYFVRIGSENGSAIQKFVKQ